MKKGRSGTNSIRSTGAWELDLLAAIVRRAVQDATRGNRLAALWLDEVYPPWRRFATVKKVDSVDSSNSCNAGQMDARIGV